MRALRQCWVVAVILAGMFAGGQSLEAQVRRALFSGGAPGWMHVIHPDHVRANSDGTGAVSVGGAVGWIEDVSGNGNHATQAIAPARALLQQAASGRYFLQPDMVDDCYDFAWVGSSTTIACILALSGASSSSGTTEVAISPADGQGISGRYLGKVSAGYYYREGDSPYITSPVAGGTLVSLVGSIRGGIARLVANDTETVGLTASPTPIGWGTLFRYGPSGGAKWGGPYYGGLVNLREPSIADIALVKRWLDELRAA